MGRFATILLVIILGGGFVGLNALYTVDEREQAVVFRFGQSIDIVNEAGDENPGLHFKLPFVDEVIRFDKRNMAFNMRSAELLAADQERLIVDAFLRYRIVDPRAYYTTVTDTVGAERALSPIMQNALRNVVASLPSDEVVSGQRAALMVQVQEAVEIEVESRALGMEVIDVRIRRADLPNQVEADVFNRMIAQRREEANGIRAEGAEEARLITAETDRQTRVIRAEAEGEARRIEGEGNAQQIAIHAAAFGRDVEFYAFYRSLEAYKSAIAAGTPIVIPPDSEFFEYFGRFSAPE
jgi:membrane protease subunit HflC